MGRDQHGGHLNLINSDALAEWELNDSGQLIGPVNMPKSDYPSLYATMKSRGWIGQFNHPASSGQFLVNGTALGYDANGAQVMVLAEVLNSSAFSTNLTQTETGRSSYEAAWNILLERATTSTGNAAAFFANDAPPYPRPCSFFRHCWCWGRPAARDLAVMRRTKQESLAVSPCLRRRVAQLLNPRPRSRDPANR